MRIMTSLRSLRCSLLALCFLPLACATDDDTTDDTMTGASATDDDADDVSDDANDDLGSSDGQADDDDDAGDDATADPNPNGDDDVADDDVADDDDADDVNAADDDAESDDDTDDTSTGDDGSGGAPTGGEGFPPGVQCADYTPCSFLDASGCVQGESCTHALGCTTAICIGGEEYCDLSCPGMDCEIGASFPGSPDCGDLVRGEPATLDPLECPGALPYDGAACDHAADDDCLYEGFGDLYSCICLGGGWQCERIAVVDDDAGTPATDAGETEQGKLFACGPVQCQSSTEYCLMEYPGVAPVEGVPIVAPGGCAPLPDECVGMASCECLGIETDLVQSQQCSELDGAVTVEIFYP